MITSERVRLRAVEREDLPRFVDWFNDPEVTAGLRRITPMSSWAETQWFDKLGDRPEEERPLAVDARLPAGGWIHIGSVGLHGIQAVDRCAEFGISIGNKEYWNRGYGSAATLLTLKHAFEALNLNRISLVVLETNPRAKSAYEKCGFVHEGILRQAIYRDGRYVDLLLMSVLRSEWDARK